MSPRLLQVGCCIGCDRPHRRGQKSWKVRKMPANESAVIPTSFLGRISARTSLISTRDYKTTVQLLDDNETICQEFKKTSNAQVILDYVCECLNIVEKDYFGLRYQDFSKHRYWMDLNKQICKQVRGPNVALRFRVRFYPSDVGVLKEEITRYMLFVQLQRDLLHGRLYCPQNEVAVLGALALQSVIGDYDAEERPKDYVAGYRLFLKQTEKLEEKIAEAHKQFRGLNPAEAEMEFLKRASKLDTYGFDPYTVVDKQKQTMYIGVTHRGIYIYHVSRMVHYIKWDELEKVDYVGKEIIITPVSSYVSPYSSSSENEHAAGTLRSISSTMNRNGLIKPHKVKNALKFFCPSAMFAKHLWRHILSQQAFFTEIDAKHIKPKFSKPRIPLLTRGSSFYFPTSRVLHEIEVEGPGKRDGPQPRFTRYPLQHQAPRQYLYNTGNKYSSLPVVRIDEKVSEVIPENVQEEQALRESLDVATVSKKEENLPLETSSPAAIADVDNVCENLAVEAPSPSEESLQQMDFLKPLCASTPAGGAGPGTMFTTASDSERFEKREPDIPCISNKASVTNSKLGATLSHNTTSIASSTAKIFFSLLLFWLLLAAVAIALFEHDSPWLNSIPALDSVRHALYEPLRHHILALYARLARH